MTSPKKYKQNEEILNLRISSRSAAEDRFIRVDEKTEGARSGSFGSNEEGENSFQTFRGQEQLQASHDSFATKEASEKRVANTQSMDDIFLQFKNE